jgi:hypothetical protein
VKLTSSECEVILSATNADKGWHVYVDEGHRFFRLLVGLARAWGVEPRRLGSGVEFELPWRALRPASPPSERRRQASRESLQKARLASRNALRKRVVEGVTLSERGEIPAHPARPPEPRDLDVLEAPSEEVRT